MRRLGSPTSSFPDAGSPARQRLRRVWRAFTAIPRPYQAVLEAHFDTGRPKRPSHLDLEPEFLAVACLLAPVNEVACASKITRIQSAKLHVSEHGADSVRAECQAIVTRAFEAFLSERFPQLQLRETREVP